MVNSNRTIDVRGLRHQTLYLVLIVLLGILYAAQYALVMPPWGLLDETQHYHYVQIIAEEHRLPVMWQDRLSEEVIDSVFDVKRYVTLGADRMPDRDVVMAPGRLDGESYEAYHPPFYYGVLSVFYPLGRDDILSNLFFLRLITVLLSSVTLVAVWFSCRVLFPENIWISIAATLFVALLPERVASISQVNNDVLLEVLCALTFYVLAMGVKDGVTWRRTLLVSLLLGLAVLTKLSALGLVAIVVGAWLVLGKRDFGHWHKYFKYAASIIAAVFFITLPLFIRNWTLYSDPTGMRAFLDFVGGDLADGSFIDRLAFGLLDLYRHSWVILWNGSRAVSKSSATLMLALMSLILVWIVNAIIKAWHKGELLLPQSAGVISLVSISVIGITVLSGYVRGFLPVVQGRFLLPVTMPTAWLMGVGLWHVGKRWRGMVTIIFFALEVVLGESVLFFHTLPNYYAPRTGGFLGYVQQTVYLFSEKGLFWDKPEFITRLLVAGVLLAIAISGLLVAIWGIWRYDFPFGLKESRAVWRYLSDAWKSIKPEIPEKSPSVEETSLKSRLLQIGSDPLLWTGVGLFILYLGWVSFYPPKIFWSLDEGGKFIHLQSVVESGKLNALVRYPWQAIDKNLEFVPLYFWSQAEGQIYSWWPVAFPFATIPFYLLFGHSGVYVLPALFGVVSAVFAGLIFRQIFPTARWLSMGVAVITGTATPIAFYSTTFWEHTLNTGLFIIGLWAVLKAWNTQKARWLLVSGSFLSFATFFRVDTVVFVIGIGAVLFLIKWRWSIWLGLVYLLSSTPWFYLNQQTMGNILSRQFIPGMTGISAPPFLGFTSAGWLFIPYTLFGAPDVGGLFIPPTVLLLGTLLLLAAIVIPFVRKWHPGVLAIYSGLLVFCAWVLFHPKGYRSVHGFVVIAPHIVFAVWMYVAAKELRQSIYGLLGLSIVFVYIVVYFIRGWVAAGGLQWGPRYLLTFYPMLVVATVVGLKVNWANWAKQFRYILVGLYALGVIIGIGFEARGLLSAQQTRNYYRQTQVDIQQLNADVLVTQCPWLTMVMPDVYWHKPIFFAQDGSNQARWREFAEGKGFQSLCIVNLDLCTLTPLDEIALSRQNNQSGLKTECFVFQ